MAIVDVMGQITPEQAEVIRIQRDVIAANYDTEGLSSEQIRANCDNALSYWNEGGAAMYRSDEVQFERNGRMVHTRVFYPYHDTPTDTAIFYCHGGGFVSGSTVTHSRVMREMAARANCIVIGVDYALAPEYTYPEPILDIAGAYHYFVEEGALHGFNIRKCGFMGDSAGSTLALGTALYLRDHNYDITPVKKLILFYGLYGLQDAPSRRLYGGPWDGLERNDIAYYEKVYLGNKELSEAPYANLLEADFSHDMPECLLIGAGLDPLVDDSRTLYQILQANNVSCKFTEYPGVLHMFIQYGRVMDTTNQALQESAAFFRC